uniref:C2H2-type domain-containing protein n=1 Tax=Ditylenchus dipsaci TaxID=166011 RepID=A0A915CTE8_9BILA
MPDSSMDSPLCCQLCEWQCREVDDLEDHLCSHHFKYHPLLCDECQGRNVYFATHAAVKRHYAQHHNKTKFYYHTKVSPEIEEDRLEVRRFLAKSILSKSTVDSHQRLSICEVFEIMTQLPDLKHTYSDLMIGEPTNDAIILATTPVNNEKEYHSHASFTTDIETVSPAPHSASFSIAINEQLNIGNDGTMAIQFLSPLKKFQLLSLLTVK